MPVAVFFFISKSMKTVLNGKLFHLEENEDCLIHGCLSTKYKLRDRLGNNIIVLHL